MNQFDLMRDSMREAEATIRAADMVSSQMARMLVGRLRKVQHRGALEALKRELRDYNMQTGQWKE